jgi:1-acyl-sn-glycerol-3-phosphate acyltransferase
MLSTLHLSSRLLGHVWRGQRTINRHFAGWDYEQRGVAMSDWSRDMLRTVGIELQVRDLREVKEQHAGSLVVCNHISWLDIFVINAWQPATFVSKHEVASWPVFGKLATSAGTLYIRREKRRDAHKLVQDIAGAIQDGRRVAIFPEGTTSDGSGLLHFHANLLHAAVSSNAPVQPLTLRYLDAATGERTPVPAYIGDMTLAQSLQLLAQHRKQYNIKSKVKTANIIAEVTVLPHQRGEDRRQLSASLRSAMAEALGVK